MFDLPFILHKIASDCTWYLTTPRIWVVVALSYYVIRVVIHFSRHRFPDRNLQKSLYSALLIMFAGSLLHMSPRLSRRSDQASLDSVVEVVNSVNKLQENYHIRFIITTDLGEEEPVPHQVNSTSGTTLSLDDIHRCFKYGNLQTHDDAYKCILSLGNFHEVDLAQDHGNSDNGSYSTGQGNQEGTLFATEQLEFKIEAQEQNDPLDSPAPIPIERDTAPEFITSLPEKTIPFNGTNALDYKPLQSGIETNETPVQPETYEKTKQGPGHGQDSEDSKSQTKEEAAK